MLLAGLVSQKKERAVVGDPGTKLQHNSMYAGVAKIFSVHDLPVVVAPSCCTYYLRIRYYKISGFDLIVIERELHNLAR